MTNPIVAITEALDTLTPQQWYQVIRADEDGPLPPCCAEVSDARDDLVALLRMPTLTGAMRVVGWFREGPYDDHVDLTGPIPTFIERLGGILGDARPGWVAPAVEDLELSEAKLTFWGGFGHDEPEWAPAPREAWGAKVAAVGDRLVSYPADPEGASNQHDVVRGLLGQALRLGAPPRMLLGLWQAAWSALSAAVRPVVAS